MVTVIKDRGFWGSVSCFRGCGKARGKLMSLLLCRREPVKHPLYIEVLGIHIYSSQELCYVICNHPLLVMDGFVGKALYSFVKNELGMGFVAGRMEKLSETGSRPEEALYLFLTECDYCTEKESQRFRQTAAAYRSLRPHGMKRQWPIICLGKNSMAVLLSAMRNF